MKGYHVWYCHLCECRRRFYTEGPDYMSTDGLPTTKCSQGHDVDSYSYYQAQKKAIDNIFKEAYLEPISTYINSLPRLRDFVT